MCTAHIIRDNAWCVDLLRSVQVIRSQSHQSIVTVIASKAVHAVYLGISSSTLMDSSHHGAHPSGAKNKMEFGQVFIHVKLLVIRLHSSRSKQVGKPPGYTTSQIN
jgi:hypothetical protein